MAKTIAAALGLPASSGLRVAILTATVTLMIGLNLALASAAYAAKSTGNDSSSPLDWIATAAEVVTAGSVILLYLQIREARDNAKAERTRGFQERYLSDEFSLSVSQALGCMRSRDAAGCVEVIKAWSEGSDPRERALPGPDGTGKASVHDIEKTLGLFEDMGTAYNLGQLDKEVVHRSFATPTVNVLTSGWWLICWLRKGRLSGETEEGRTEKIYAEFQDMCRELRRDNVSLKRDRRLMPSPAIRSLCLPTSRDHQPLEDKTWEASRRLSIALTALVDSAEREGGLAKALSELAKGVGEIEGPPPAHESPVFQLARRLAGSEGDDRSAVEWQVMLIPQSIDRHYDEDWRKERAAAAELAQSLNHGSVSALDATVAHIEERARTLSE